MQCSSMSRTPACKLWKGWQYLKGRDVGVLIHNREQAIVGVLATAQLHSPVDLAPCSCLGAALDGCATALLLALQR